MDKILCLDLGVTTGWSYIDRKGEITSGSRKFEQRTFDGGGIRFFLFRKWLEEKLRVQGKPDVIFYEAVTFRQKSLNASLMYGGLFGILQSWCEENDIPYAGVNVTTLKKWLTNKGNCKKNGMISEIRNRGYDPIDDNEADALALLLYIIGNNFNSKEINNVNNHK